MKKTIITRKVSINAPKQKVWAEFKLIEEGSETHVIGTFEYGTTNALGGLLNSMAMKKMNEKTWVGFIAGIKHHVETGEDVNKDTPLDKSQVLV